jgi:hypothetical protein
VTSPKGREQFYARNAKIGRTVRFSLEVDMQHVPETVRKRHGLKLGGVKVRGGTLTPRQTRQLLDIVFGKKEI